VLTPILDKSNRGLLLDTAVLAANLLAMPLLSRAFLDLIQQADRGDATAAWVLWGYSVALFVLAPVGATLKRWHYHRRRPAADPLDGVAGCVFNPIFYFCLVVVIFAAINAFVLQHAFDGREPSGTVFVSSIFLGLALVILHTWLTYRYFSPPRKPPRSAFLRSPVSELLGDACLFTNMLLFQLIWNLFSFVGLGAPGSIVEGIGRLGILVFLGLLLYFPPRMFYLVEDIGKRRTWVMILLANAPVLVRVLFGWGG
jgi:hypothetical protein